MRKLKRGKFTHAVYCNRERVAYVAYTPAFIYVKWYIDLCNHPRYAQIYRAIREGSSRVTSHKNVMIYEVDYI